MSPLYSGIFFRFWWQRETCFPGYKKINHLEFLERKELLAIDGKFASLDIAKQHSVKTINSPLLFSGDEEYCAGKQLLKKGDPVP